MILNYDKYKDECAVAGVYGNYEAANLIYLCLYAMQHRGQQGTGIAVSNGKNIQCLKEHGLVADVYSKQKINTLSGNIAIGHNRYPTDGNFTDSNLQPVLAELPIGKCAIAYNGSFINSFKIRKEMITKGSIFSTETDIETVMHLLAKSLKKHNIIESLSGIMNKLIGAYSIILMTDSNLIGMRDPNGIRPLTLGMIEDTYIIVSETVALDLIGAKFIREIEPGEIVVINKDGIKSYFPYKEKTKPSPCIFEYIYFARPDSFMFGQSVYQVRKALGSTLALESPVDADIVIPVPDSGVTATLGYSKTSKIPIEIGLIRNHYVGRTFIEPSQHIRDFSVKVKLNPVKEIINNKRVIVVDDSIVRGTTSKKIVKMLRDAGAKEVHMRISSPPTIFPCYYGIDTPTKKELISNTHTENEIKNYIEADSLGFLTLQGMLNAVNKQSFCTACFTGNYPIDPTLMITNK